MIKKVAVLGPESTGKSTLCAELADHYKTLWVKEYAREYLLENGTNYTFDNLLDMAKGQLKLEEAGIAEAERKIAEDIKESTGIISTGTGYKQFIFIDTNMYLLKVWCEFVFGKCHNWILNQVVERKYDLYLLCDIDLPWVKDELRKYPDLQTRHQLYHHYKDIMINQSVPWANIRGNDGERLQKAIDAINKIS